MLFNKQQSLSEFHKQKKKYISEKKKGGEKKSGDTPKVYGLLLFYNPKKQKREKRSKCSSMIDSGTCKITISFILHVHKRLPFKVAYINTTLYFILFAGVTNFLMILT